MCVCTGSGVGSRVEFAFWVMLLMWVIHFRLSEKRYLGMGFCGTCLMKNGVVKAVEGVLVGFAHDVALLFLVLFLCPVSYS